MNALHPVSGAAVLLTLLAGCTGTPGHWTRADFDVATFAADDRACRGEMYASRGPEMRSLPNWHIHRFCLERRGYRHVTGESKKPGAG